MAKQKVKKVKTKLSASKKDVTVETKEKKVATKKKVFKKTKEKIHNSDQFAIFQYDNGNPVYMPIESTGPQTNFYIESESNDFQDEMMERQLLFYYQSHV